MANERLIFLACNIYSILAEYSPHSCTFRWALWPMGLWFKFVLVILDLIRFDLIIRFSPGGGNSIKVLCTSDLRDEVEVHIFNYLKHQFIYYRRLSQVNGGKVTWRRRWSADPVPEPIISRVMLTTSHFQNNDSVTSIPLVQILDWWSVGLRLCIFLVVYHLFIKRMNL